MANSGPLPEQYYCLLLTQLPTSNERKIPPHLKIKPAKFHNGGFTQDLYMHICSISVKFLLWKNSMNALKSVARTQRVNSPVCVVRNQTMRHNISPWLSVSCSKNLQMLSPYIKWSSMCCKAKVFAHLLSKQIPPFGIARHKSSWHRPIHHAKCWTVPLKATEM